MEDYVKALVKKHAFDPLNPWNNPVNLDWFYKEVTESYAPKVTQHLADVGYEVQGQLRLLQSFQDHSIWNLYDSTTEALIPLKYSYVLLMDKLIYRT